MSDHLWILENSLLDKDRMRKRNDILDFFLLIILTLLLPLATIGKIEPDNGTHDDIYRYSDGYSFGPFYHYVNQVPDTLFAVLIFSLIGIFLILYYVFRYRHTGRKPGKILLTVTLIYLCLRLVGTFLFPYGPLDFHFISPPEDNTPFTISYSGFSIGGRIIQFVSELLSVFYVLELLTFLPTYSRHSYSLFRILIWICILIPTFLLFYSWIVEGTRWLENIRYLIDSQKRQDAFSSGNGLYPDILSLTTNKNVFGYFLLIGCFSFMTLFFHKHHFIYMILAIIYCAFDLIILSKTPFLIGAMAIFIASFSYPVLFHSKKLKSSILSMILFTIMVIVFNVFSFRYGLRLLILTTINTANTLWTRINHVKIALSMFKNQSPLLFIFGYGRFPFTAIYLPYQHIIPYEALWTSHNCYIESIMHTGIFGLVYLLFQDFLFLNRVRKTFRFHKESFVYFITFISISLYSIFEPRILFMNTGFEIILAYFLIIFPACIDYGNKEEPCLL